jgi:hypothetical protein
MPFGFIVNHGNFFIYGRSDMNTDARDWEDAWMKFGACCVLSW